MFGVFLHSFYLNEVYYFFEDIAEKVNQWIVTHKTQIKIAFINTSFSIHTYTTIVPQHVGSLKFLIKFLWTFLGLGFML